jgi:hypothetical protein
MAELQCTATYRDVPAFPGYRAGDDGSVWTRWERYYPTGQSKLGVRYRIGERWRRMKTRTVSKYGHQDVQLRRDGAGHHCLVHRLVLEAFVGPCPGGMECAHENGIGSDNRLENLRWATKKDNHADRWRHGTMPVGEKAYNHKLTASVRVEVLDLWANGLTKAEIGRQVGLSRRSVLRVIEEMT